MSKITVEATKFKNELSFVNSCVSGKQNPVWAHIFFETAGKTLKLTGTDGIATASSVVELVDEPEEPVYFTIEGHKLENDMRLTSNPNLVISLSETRVTVLDGKTRYGYGVNLEAKESLKNSMLFEVAGNYVTIPMRSDTLNRALRIASVFSADKDQTQFNLSGVTLNAKSDTLVSCSMDGQRAVDLTQHEAFTDRDEKLFIGKIYIDLLSRISDYPENQSVSVDYGENAIKIHCNNRLAIIRRSATENTPPISQSITNKLELASFKLSLNGKDLYTSIHKLHNATNGKYRPAKLTIEDGLMKITAGGTFDKAETSLEDFYDEIAVESADKFELVANAEFLMDFLKLVDGKVDFAYLPRQESKAGGVIITHPSGLRCMLALMS